MKGQINSFFANLSYFENRMTFFDFQIGFFRGSNNKAALFSVCIALSFCTISFSFLAVSKTTVLLDPCYLAWKKNKDRINDMSCNGSIAMTIQKIQPHPRSFFIFVNKAKISLVPSFEIRSVALPILFLSSFKSVYLKYWVRPFVHVPYITHHI
uniref:Transmembrane protein n=1 Tax=Cacopsylla melanoneura TaxID=428564 RepID=A0A8D8UDT8_9HEMI